MVLFKPTRRRRGIGDFTRDKTSKRQKTERFFYQKLLRSDYLQEEKAKNKFFLFGIVYLPENNPLVFCCSVLLGFRLIPGDFQKGEKNLDDFQKKMA